MGKFSEMFSNQLASIRHLNFANQKVMTPEEKEKLLAEIQTEKARGWQAGMSAQKTEDEINRERRLEGERENYNELLRIGGYIPDPEWSPIEEEQNSRIDAQQEFAAFQRAFPDRAKMSFEEFYQSGRKAKADVAKVEADTIKTLQPEAEKSQGIAELAKRGAGALNSGKYEGWFNRLSDDAKAVFADPSASPDEIKRTLEASLGGAKAGETFVSDVAQATAKGAEANRTIQDFGSYVMYGNERLDKRLNSDNKEDVGDLRSNYISQSKPLEKALKEIELTEQNLKGGSQGLNAVNAIYRHMKSLDESGAVREGDIALFMESLGLGQRIEGGFFKLKDGLTFNDTLVGQIKEWLNNQKRNIQSRKDELIEETKQNAIFRGVHPMLIDSRIKLESSKREPQRAASDNDDKPEGTVTGLN